MSGLQRYLGAQPRKIADDGIDDLRDLVASVGRARSLRLAATVWRARVDEAAEDGDVGQIGNPELVRAIDLAVPGAIREDRLIMVAVRDGDEAAPARRMHGVLAHQALDLLVVHRPAPMPQRRQP